MRRATPPLCMFAAIATLSLAAAAAFAAPIAGARESAPGSLTKAPTVKRSEPIKAGAKAPDFKVQDLEGKEFHLASSVRKDAVLLFFWSFFCGACREEIPMVNQVSRDYRDRGLQVVGVNLDGGEMKKAIDKFAVNEKIAFRIVFDEMAGDAYRVADPYGVAGTPALFLIDRRGIVAYGNVGAVTGEKLKTEIGKILK